MLRLHSYLNSCARTHTRNWPVAISGAELELELDTIGANLLHMCEDSSHQTTHETNDKLGRRGWTPLDPKQNIPTNSADNHPERLLSGEWETDFNLNVNVREHYSLRVITTLDTTYLRTHVLPDRLYM